MDDYLIKFPVYVLVAKSQVASGRGFTLTSELRIVGKRFEERNYLAVFTDEDLAQRHLDAIDAHASDPCELTLAPLNKQTASILARFAQQQMAYAGIAIDPPPPGSVGNSPRMAMDVFISSCNS